MAGMRAAIAASSPVVSGGKGPPLAIVVAAAHWSQLWALQAPCRVSPRPAIHGLPCIWCLEKDEKKTESTGMDQIYEGVRPLLCVVSKTLNLCW